jgi:hypothetical protein
MSEIKTNQISSLTGSNSDITLDPDGTGDLIIASGNVGIGTTSPGGSLEVYKAGTSEVLIGTDNGGTAQLSLYENNDGTKEGLLKYDGTNNRIHLATSGAPNALVIPRDSGRVCIGGTSPSQKFVVTNAGADNIVMCENSSASIQMFMQATASTGSVGTLTNHDVQLLQNNTERVKITSGGINSATIYNNTTVSGSNLFISGGYNFQRSTSSSRYKTEITDATHGLDAVMNLRPVTYKGINDGDRVFGGLIAEEVHDAGLTEFVDYSEDEDGNERPEGLHYGHMAALAFKAIQELKTGLDAEKAKVADLEARLTALENA